MNDLCAATRTFYPSFDQLYLRVPNHTQLLHLNSSYFSLEQRSVDALRGNSVAIRLNPELINSVVNYALSCLERARRGRGIAAILL